MSAPEFPRYRRRLAVRINMALLRLQRLEQQRRTLEQEIDSFLSEYFKTIAARLPAHVALFDDGLPNQPGNATRTQTQQPQPREELESLEQLMHQLYRRLARSCHPDLHPDMPADTMSAVNNAYENKELGSLILLSQQILQPDANSTAPGFSLSDLQHYYNHITQLTRQTEQTLKQLQSSDANRLRREMLLARLRGHDMVARVAEGITNTLTGKEAV